MKRFITFLNEGSGGTNRQLRKFRGLTKALERHAAVAGVMGADIQRRSSGAPENPTQGEQELISIGQENFGVSPEAAADVVNTAFSRNARKVAIDQLKGVQEKDAEATVVMQKLKRKHEQGKIITPGSGATPEIERGFDKIRQDAALKRITGEPVFPEKVTDSQTGKKVFFGPQGARIGKLLTGRKVSDTVYSNVPRITNATELSRRVATYLLNNPPR